MNLYSCWVYALSRYHTSPVKYQPVTVGDVGWFIKVEIGLPYLAIRSYGLVVCPCLFFYTLLAADLKYWIKKKIYNSSRLHYELSGTRNHYKFIETFPVLSIFWVILIISKKKNKRPKRCACVHITLRFHCELMLM